MDRKIALTLICSNAILLSGCASHEYVDRHLAEVSSSQTAALGRLDDKSEKATAKVAVSAEAAMDRGNAAYTLAEGKFSFVTQLTGDGPHFAAGKAALSAEDKARLVQLAAKLKTANANVYIEIQGHTDDRGSTQFKQAIGAARAEAVRLFLNQQGVALNRMSAISYGDTAPIAQNTTEQGRAANRRVVIIAAR